MTDRTGRSELHHVATEGTVSQAQVLLDAGQDANLRDSDGFVPLHFAAQQGNVGVARVLLAHGAAVDVVNKFGNTPLFVAVGVSRGDGRMIELLRDAGADPYRLNASGSSPLALARLIANYDVAQFFADVV
jgi:ankyrin repeat protein